MLLRLSGHPGFSFWWNWLKPGTRNGNHFSESPEKLMIETYVTKPQGACPHLCCLCWHLKAVTETDYSLDPMDAGADYHLLREKSFPYVSSENVRFYIIFRASLVAQLEKNLPAMRETWVRSPGWEDPFQKGKATHSSIPAYRIPWSVQSIGSTKSQIRLSKFHFHFISYLVVCIPNFC